MVPIIIAITMFLILFRLMFTQYKNLLLNYIMLFGNDRNMMVIKVN